LGTSTEEEADLASFAPALQTGAAVTTDSSFLLAHTTASLIVPDGTGTSISSGKTVGIRFLGAQDEDGHHSQEKVQELELHLVTFRSFLLVNRALLRFYRVGISLPTNLDSASVK